MKWKLRHPLFLYTRLSDFGRAQNLRLYDYKKIMQDIMTTSSSKNEETFMLYVVSEL